MRDVSKKVDMTPAALYYHFSNKESLYIATVNYAFKTRLADVLCADLKHTDPWDRLEQLIFLLCDKFANDCELQRLMQWASLDTDELRSQALVTGVFQPFYEIGEGILRQINPKLDGYRSTIALFGLIVFPFDMTQVSPFLDGYVSAQKEPKALAAFILQLLKGGLEGL